MTPATDLVTVELTRQLDVLALGIAHNVADNMPVREHQIARFTELREELQDRAKVTGETQLIEREEGEAYGEYLRRCLG